MLLFLAQGVLLIPKLSSKEEMGTVLSQFPEQPCLITQGSSLLLALSCTSNTGVGGMSLCLPAVGSRIPEPRST